MSPTRRTEALCSTRRSPRASRSALVLLVVAAALLAPVRASGDPTPVRGGAHQLVPIGATAAGHHHLAVAHGSRSVADGHGRAGTPLGTLPTAALVATALITLLAVARRRRDAVRRPRPACSPRGPPTSFAIG